MMGKSCSLEFFSKGLRRKRITLVCGRTGDLLACQHRDRWKEYFFPYLEIRAGPMPSTVENDFKFSGRIDATAAS